MVTAALDMEEKNLDIEVWFSTLFESILMSLFVFKNDFWGFSFYVSIKMKTFTGYRSSSKGRTRTSKSSYSSSSLGYGNVGYSGSSGSVGYNSDSGAISDLGYGHNSGSGSYTGF